MKLEWDKHFSLLVNKYVQHWPKLALDKSAIILKDKIMQLRSTKEYRLIETNPPAYQSKKVNDNEPSKTWKLNETKTSAYWSKNIYIIKLIKKEQPKLSSLP